MKDPSGEMKRAVEQVGDRGGASAGGKKRISIPFASHSEQPDAGSVNATATPMDSPAASSDRTQPLIVHGVTIPVKPKPPGEEGENLGLFTVGLRQGLAIVSCWTLTSCFVFLLLPILLDSPVATRALDCYRMLHVGLRCKYCSLPKVVAR